MDKIDYEFNHEGFTLYRVCFNQYLTARPCNYLTKPKEGWEKLVPKVEDTFFWLVKSGKKKHDIAFINKIIQKPDPIGQTCFSFATRCSRKIAEFIIDQDIEINTISSAMVTASFKFPELAELMMKKNINPNVIAWDGKSEFEDWPGSFEKSKCKELAKNFPKSIHFVTSDTKCKNCPPNCKSNLKAFFLANGSLINEKEKLGSGGFGTVFGGKWHGEDVAMKCIVIDEIERRNFVNEQVKDFEKSISEYRSQLNAKGSGVLIPYAMVRQQNQDKKDGKSVPLNYNVFIYPRFDLNLYELHNNYYHQFNDNILGNILEKCLIRK